MLNSSLLVIGSLILQNLWIGPWRSLVEDLRIISHHLGHWPQLTMPLAFERDQLQTFCWYPSFLLKSNQLALIALVHFWMGLSQWKALFSGEAILHQAQLAEKTLILVIQGYLDAMTTFFYTPIIQISILVMALHCIICLRPENSHQDSMISLWGCRE
jgi:hypothetical protein